MTVGSLSLVARGLKAAKLKLACAGQTCGSLRVEGQTSGNAAWLGQKGRVKL
jgi:hypothetical protein